jgi:hypothetical protein
LTSCEKAVENGSSAQLAFHRAKAAVLMRLEEDTAACQSAYDWGEPRENSRVAAD